MAIAVTGATGFLGLHLIRGLLAEHRSLVVLARGEPGAVLGRIGDFLTLVGEPRPDLPARIRVLPADVTLPRFGMPSELYEELAGSLDVLWHSAGNTTLDADLGLLRRVNVEGTRNALDLVTAGPRRPMLYHVSTAFVAGARRYGTVYDDELTDEHGFEVPYERSKYEAEVLVRDWSREHRRGAVVFRPSVLTTDLPAGSVPTHPTLFATKALRSLVQTSGLAYAPGGPEARLAGHPSAHLNVMPVEDAAAVMIALARRPPPERVETYHVVHGEELPISVLLRVFAEAVPIRFMLVPQIADPTPLERMAQLLSGALRYAHHRRRYDDTRVRALVEVRPSRGRLDVDYLLPGVQPVAAR
jgi:thioester reductase-like protein